MVGGRVLVEGGRATLVDEDELQQDYVQAVLAVGRRMGDVPVADLEAYVAQFGTDLRAGQP